MDIPGNNTVQGIPSAERRDSATLRFQKSGQEPIANWPGAGRIGLFRIVRLNVQCESTKGLPAQPIAGSF
jgi:hypothetical protein